jgi:hypothetical protein
MELIALHQEKYSKTMHHRCYQCKERESYSDFEVSVRSSNELSIWRKLLQSQVNGMSMANYMA